MYYRELAEVFGRCYGMWSVSLTFRVPRCGGLSKLGDPFEPRLRGDILSSHSRLYTEDHWLSGSLLEYLPQAEWLITQH